MPAPGSPPSYPSCKILGDGVSPDLVHQCIFSTDHIIGTLKKLKLLTIVTITGRGKYIVSENTYLRTRIISMDRHELRLLKSWSEEAMLMWRPERLELLARQNDQGWVESLQA